MTTEEFSKTVRNLRGELSHYAYGNLLGVNGHTILYWETNVKNIPLGSIYKIKKRIRKTPDQIEFLQAVNEL